MDQLFDKIPYEVLEARPPIQVLAGAAGVGLALFLAAFFTLFSAVNTEFETLAKKKAETENKLKQYRNIVGSKDSVFKTLVGQVGELSVFKRQMPAQDDLNNLLKRITVLGEKREIDVIKFQMEEGSINDFYKKIPFHITFRGGLWGTMDMFAALQNMLRIVDVEALDFSVVKTKIYSAGGLAKPVDSVPLLVSSFTANTFVYVEGSANEVRK